MSFPKVFASVLALVSAFAGAASAQPGTAYPSRPVKIVIPLGPGNSLEIAMRLVADKLTSALGQPFLIEPQPGAAGQIGAERVARSPADGYTLLCANDGVITMLPSLQRHVPFDPVRDFSPIVQMVGIPFVLVVHPSVPARNADELVQLARAQPGKLEFSSGGIGSAQQLAMELFMGLIGTRLVHVPYKGAPQAAMDVVAGQIPATFAGVPIVASHIRQGRLRALGLASSERLQILPDTPTLAEQGIAFRFATWGGLFAPAGTPDDIVRRLNASARAALGSADVRTRMSELGFEIYGNSPEQFAGVVKDDLKRMAAVIAQAGIKPQ